MQLPEDLRGRQFGAICEFRPPQRTLNGKAWTQQLLGNLGTTVVTEHGAWSTSRIEYLTQGTPPRARLYELEPVQTLRWAVGTQGLLIKGIVVMAKDRIPVKNEVLPWIPADAESGLFSELTIGAGDGNRLTMTVANELCDKVRAALGQQPIPREVPEGRARG